MEFFYFWVPACFLAWLTDRIIKRYWGKSGLKIATLLVAIFSLAQGTYERSVIDLAFGVFMLWAARPTTETSSPSQLPS